MSLDVGDRITVEVLWVDPLTGDAIDATTTLVYTDPSGNATTIPDATLSNPSLGLFRYTITVDEAGVWTYAFTASGAHVEVETGYFLVETPDPTVGPCEPWVAGSEIFDCKPASSVAAVDRDYALAGDVADAASRILYVLSGRRYPGVCIETVRPCRRAARYGQPVGWSWNPGWGTCGCASLSACGCGGISEIRLGGEYPVRGIARVRVDGSTVAASSYRIDDRGWLVRTDGLAWPSSQDLSADPASETGTFDVQYYYGTPPPPDGVRGAKRLASELYMACTGGTCSLPARLASISRQGETLAFLDPQEFLADGRTGLYEVDLFLTAERYGRANLGTVVASPEFLSSQRRTS